MEKKLEKIIENLRLNMRVGCNCKACELENANIGENCVIRKALEEVNPLNR